MSRVTPIQHAPHPAEDTFVPLHNPTADGFVPLHNPQQESRTKAVLDRHTVVGNIVLGAGAGEPDKWNSPLPERMMNTGRMKSEQRKWDEQRDGPKPRQIPSDGAIYAAVSRADELKRRLAPVPQIGGLKIYLAGPMTGIAHFNFPAFHAAAKVLRQHGHEVFNPAEADVIRHGGIDLSLDNETGDPAKSVAEHGFSLRDALRDDTHYICTTANAIAMLSGWEHSRGARAEHALACALGHQVLYLGGFYG